MDYVEIFDNEEWSICIRAEDDGSIKLSIYNKAGNNDVKIEEKEHSGGEYLLLLTETDNLDKTSVKMTVAMRKQENWEPLDVPDEVVKKGMEIVNEHLEMQQWYEDTWIKLDDKYSLRMFVYDNPSNPRTIASIYPSEAVENFDKCDEFYSFKTIYDEPLHVWFNVEDNRDPREDEEDEPENWKFLTDEDDHALFHDDECGLIDHVSALRKRLIDTEKEVEELKKKLRNEYEDWEPE